MEENKDNPNIPPQIKSDASEINWDELSSYLPSTEEEVGKVLTEMFVNMGVLSPYYYNLDYISWMDISKIELQEIIDKADSIITENNESPEKLATAYLKKAQCMQKDDESSKYYRRKKIFKDTVDDTQEQVKNLIEKALELLPNMPEALMQMGKVYYKESAAEEGNIDKAIDIYTKAIQLKPDYAAAHNNLGVLYASESYSRAKNDNLNFEKAINEYTKAIQIRPFEASYYFNRGRNYSELEDHEKAIDDFSNAIKYGSDEFKKKTLIFYLRGQEYTEMGDYEKAIADFSESLRLTPNHDMSFLMLGNAYIGAGKIDNAKANLDEYLRKKRELGEIDESQGLSEDEINKLLEPP